MTAAGESSPPTEGPVVPPHEQPAGAILGPSGTPIAIHAGGPTQFARRGMIGGAVLLACGLAFLLPPLGVPNSGAYLFVALGLAFAAAWWFGSRQYVYLVPAGVLLGFGVGLVLPVLLDLPSDLAGPVFLGTLAIGLAAVYFLASYRRLPIAPAAILGAVALARVLLGMQLIPDALQPFFVPAILIVVGLYLLVEPRAH